MRNMTFTKKQYIKDELDLIRMQIESLTNQLKAEDDYTDVIIQNAQNDLNMALSKVTEVRTSL